MNKETLEMAPNGALARLTRIDHINMTVKDIKASEKFYGSVFGFRLKESGERGGKRWAILGIPDRAYLCLYEVGDQGLEDRDMQINHFGFHIENFGALERRLRESGVKINYSGAVSWAASRSIYIEDPSGYEIELSENIGGGLH